MQHTFKYIAALIIFGSNGIVASYIDATSAQIIFLRVLIGALVLLGVFLVSRRTFTFWQHKKAFAFTCLAGVAMGAEWIILYESFNYIGVGMATLLNYVGPIIVIALSPLLFKEKITWNKVVGIGVVLIGVVLLNGAVAGSVNPFGVALALSTAILYAVFVFATKKADPIRGLEFTVLQLCAALVVALVAMLFTGGFQIDLTQMSISAILQISLVGTGVACLLYFSGMAGLRAQSAAVFGYLEPVAAVGFSALFLGEVMTSVQLIGAACVLCGACFAQLRFKPLPSPRRIIVPLRHRVASRVTLGSRA